MRLFNVDNLELVEFHGRDIPRYSILSHTWGHDEVQFRDLGIPGYEKKAGFNGAIKLSK